MRWLHLKGKEFSGPSGGNGGDGGSVSIRGVRDLSLLARYRGSKDFEAGPGEDGGSSLRHGKRGQDCVIDLPLGSVVHNKKTGETHEVLVEGQRTLVLAGGRGGAGNAVFKSSINRTPKESTPGAPGEAATLAIELRLIADAGLVGLPNAGKTSLLNAVTGAGGKVASYPFTTLDPNLGVLYGFILADIPGLIEGASAGRGLGFKFLRHIARTKLILHCVSLESDNPMREYLIVRRELEGFEHGALMGKTEVIVLTKSDTKTPHEVTAAARLFESTGKEIVPVSILEDSSVKNLKDSLVRVLRYHSSV